MQFYNIVTSDAGVELAGFISSIDARHYAQTEVDAHYYPYLTVVDYAGGVTKHVKGLPVEIIEKGELGGILNPVAPHVNAEA